MQTSRLIYVLILFFLTNPVFSQKDIAIPITEKYDLEITDFSAKLEYKPKSIYNLFEDSLGIVWLLGTEQTTTIFNSKIETKLWKFNGHQFESFDLPKDIKNFSLYRSNIFEFDQRKLVIYSNETGKSYFFDRVTSLFSPIENNRREYIGTHNIVSHRGKNYCSTVVKDSVQLYRFEGLVAHKVFSTHIGETDAYSPFFFVNDDIIINLYPTKRNIMQIDTSGKIIKNFDLSDLGIEIGNVKNITFRNCVANDQVISLNISNYGPFKFDNSSNKFIPISKLKFDHSISWVFGDLSKNYLASFSLSPYRELALFTYNRETLSLDTLLRISPSLRKIASKDFTKYMWFSDETSLRMAVLNPKTIKFSFEGGSTRTITKAPNGEILVAFEGYKMWESINAAQATSNTTTFVPLLNEGKTNGNRLIHFKGNEIWCNTSTELLKVNQVTKEKTSFKFPRSDVEYMTVVGDDLILFGYKNGEIMGFDMIKEKIFPIGIVDPTSTKKRCLDIYAIDNKTVLIGGEQGLFELDVTNKKIKKLKDIPVMTIEKIKNGRIYLGTLNNKLYEYIREKNIVKELASLESSIATITEDNDGRLWLATFNGVSIYDIKSQLIYNVSPSELVNTESNRYSSYFDPQNNKMYIGTIAGLTVFDLNQYTPIGTKHLLYFSSSKTYDINSQIVNETYYLQRELDLNLTYKDPYLKVSFYMDDPKRHAVQYFYKFENQENWLPLENKNELEFTRLAPGHHRIVISAKDRKNQWSGNELKLHVFVKDIFYKQMWFYLLVATSLFSLIFYWFRRNKLERIRLEKEVELRTKELQEDKKKIEKQSEELLELDEMKNQFFANISHELRTPLTLLLSPLQQLNKGNNISEDRYKYFLQLMQDNGKLLQDRIDEMLELSRLEAKEVKLARQTVDLYELIDFSTRIFKTKTEEKEIQYDVTQIGTNFTIICDERRLSKIIQNIVNNAIKFTSRGGNVSCIFSIENDQLSMRFSDTGIGLKEDQINKIFTRFYQVKVDNTNANPGTGIGLSMVQEYIDLMGGNITVESTMHKGSIFHVRLPIEKTDDINIENNYFEEKPLSITFVPLPSKEKPIILLTEDNHDLRQYVKTLLSDYFQIVEAENGLVALNILQSRKYSIDVILSDIMMPEMDGVSLLSTVRSQEEWRLLPFIFLTAKHNEEDIIKAYKMGIDDYIKKPFSEEELLYRLNAVYQNYKQRVETNNQGHVAEDEEAHTMGNYSKDESPSEIIIQFEKLITDHLDKPDFSTDMISEKLAISKRTLIRLVKKEVGTTPGEFIKEIKLNRARKLIQQDNFTSLDDILPIIGYTDKRYFKKMYFERFGTKLST